MRNEDVVPQAEQMPPQPKRAPKIDWFAGYYPEDGEETNTSEQGPSGEGRLEVDITG